MSAARRLRESIEAAAGQALKITWPSPAWRGRHVEFARDVLGKRTLAPHQVEILDEYYGSGRIELVCCTGQKLGKTEDLIIVCLFDWATEPRLNGFVMGPKIDWIDEGLWPRFVVDVLSAYYPCADCMPKHQAWCALVEENPLDETPRPERCARCSSLIPSELKDPKDPKKGRSSEWLDEKKSERGLRDTSNGRAIRGYTARKEGGKGGFSGKVRFYLDESSDISDVDRETIRGNMSGGGKVIAFGNLLYVTGWFYRAFKGTPEAAQKALRAWADSTTGERTFRMSSRLSPNVPGTTCWLDGETTANDNTGRPIPGMATREDIEANLRAWKGTNLVLQRIDARPPAIVEGQLASADRVRVAELRWRPEEATGLLQLGVDVARARDRFAVAIRRGQTIIELEAEVLGDDDYTRAVEMTIAYGRKHRKLHERKPRLVYDASGLEGERYGRELRAQRADEFFDLYPVQMAHPPRNRRLYDKRRDELAHGFAEWLRAGAIPLDGELEAEIEATTAQRVEVSYGASGHKWEVLRVITNDDIKRIIGRSPDKLNACQLAVVDVDGSEDAAEASPEAKAVPASLPRRAPPPDNDDFIVEVPAPRGIYDRHASASAALWGRA